MNNDAYSNVRLLPALNPATVADAEGLLIDLRKYTGVAEILLTVKEADSQADTKTVDVTAHNVASDSEAPVTGNKVGTFTQIVGSNGTGVAAKSERLRVDISALDLSTKPYLQLLVDQANSYSGVIAATVALIPEQKLPANAAAGKDSTAG